MRPRVKDGPRLADAPYASVMQTNKANVKIYRHVTLSVADSAVSRVRPRTEISGERARLLYGQRSRYLEVGLA